MAIVKARVTKLDQQVEAYLATRKTLTLNDVRWYQVKRAAGDYTTLTLELFVDDERFDELG